MPPSSLKPNLLAARAHLLDLPLLQGSPSPVQQQHHADHVDLQEAAVAADGLQKAGQQQQDEVRPGRSSLDAAAAAAHSSSSGTHRGEGHAEIRLNKASSASFHEGLRHVGHMGHHGHGSSSFQADGHVTDDESEPSPLDGQAIATWILGLDAPRADVERLGQAIADQGNLHPSKPRGRRGSGSRSRGQGGSGSRSRVQGVRVQGGGGGSKPPCPVNQLMEDTRHYRVLVFGVQLVAFLLSYYLGLQ